MKFVSRLRTMDDYNIQKPRYAKLFEQLFRVGSIGPLKGVAKGRGGARPSPRITKKIKFLNIGKREYVTYLADVCIIPHIPLVNISHRVKIMNKDEKRTSHVNFGVKLLT